MSLSDLASLGSFVSGFAVLISLIFLYFQLKQIGSQVKQAETNQRAALNQGYVTRATENTRWLAESPIVELRTRVFEGDTSFTAEELSRLTLAFRITILNAQDSYLQHKSGLVDTMNHDQAMRSLNNFYLNQPVYRALWRQLVPSIAPEFADVIEILLKETPLAKPIDSVSAFRTDLTEVTAAEY